MHRNRFTDMTNKLDWLTLPLTKTPRDTTRIKDLEFRPNFESLIRQEFPRFKIFSDPEKSEIIDRVIPTDKGVLDFLQNTLESTLSWLEIDVQVQRSSEFEIRNDLVGQDRIIEICKAAGGDSYINLNGGFNYYSHDVFKQNGIELKILEPYLGLTSSILERIAYQHPLEVRAELKANSGFIQH